MPLKIKNIIQEEFKRLKDIAEKFLKREKKQPQLAWQQTRLKKDIFRDGPH